MPQNLTKYIDVALEREIELKRAALSKIEAECAQQELDIATLNSEIEHFRDRYWRLVAPLYARLDEAFSLIAAYGVTADPDDPHAQKVAAEARKRAEESARQANRKFEFEEEIFQPSDELRLAFRTAARQIHPDRASDDADRVIRNDLMAKINVAYSHEDLDEIERIVDAYKHNRGTEIKLSGSEELIRLEKQIRQLKQRMVDIGKAKQSLLASDLGKLKREVDIGEDVGLDPLGDMASTLEAKIADANKQLDALRAKYDQRRTEFTDSAVIVTANEEAANDTVPSSLYSDELTFTTARGEVVASKSETIIANLLHQLGLDYKYKYPVEGKSGIKRPDFMIFDSAKKMLLWDHIEMPCAPEDRAIWEQKLTWYIDNGFVELDNLFITSDAPDGSFETSEVMRVAEQLLARM